MGFGIRFDGGASLTPTNTVLALDFQPDNVWFTADHHFCHEGILHPDHGSSRADCWETVDQMNSALLEQWCDTVGRRDIVYSIGDLLFHVGVTKAIETLRRLSGFQVILIGGNHDDTVLRKLARQGKLPDHVSFVPQTMNEYVGLDLRIDGKQVFMRHFPEVSNEEWPGQSSGTLLLHGHSHGKHKERPNALDVGWDVHGQLLSFADVGRCFEAARMRANTAT